jgi:hypothetical protein
MSGETPKQVSSIKNNQAMALSALVSEAEATLQKLTDLDREQFVNSRLLTTVYRIHAHGRVLLRGIDRETYRTYCELFSASPAQQSRAYAWPEWNAYILDQFNRCIGILAMVDQAGWKIARDTTASRIFVSHGKFTTAFKKLETFIRALGCIPVYDVEEPTAGKTINKHVERLFETSDFYVILATAETENADGTKLPNHNVTLAGC